MTTQTVFRAAWILPVTTPPIKDGFVAVKDGLVTSVGPVAGRPTGEGFEDVDLADAILTPGFVNAHTHLELSHLGNGLVPGDRGYVPWVEEQLRVRAERSPKEAATGIDAAIASLVSAGTVAVADVTNSLATLEPLGASPLHALVLHEILGVDATKAETVHTQTTGARSEANRDPAGSRVRVAIAAHAPHSVSRELFARLQGAGGVKSIHVAESASETEFLRNGEGEWRGFLDRRVGPVAFPPPGTSPVRYLDEIGVLTPGLLAVHCVRVDADDAGLLASRGAVAVLCPRSNEYLGNGVPPLALLLGSGVAIALGSDSLASCASLDVVDDARFLARRFPRIPSETLLHAATRGGARALGFDDLGEIREGALARFAAFEGGAAAKDPAAFLLNEAAPPRGIA